MFNSSYKEVWPKGLNEQILRHGSGASQESPKTCCLPKADSTNAASRIQPTLQAIDGWNLNSEEVFEPPDSTFDIRLGNLLVRADVHELRRIGFRVHQAP